jgi:hypothetical protein
MALTNKLNAIGDAIRNKTGSTAKLTLDQMPTAINSITTGSGSSGGIDFATYMNGKITTVTAEDLKGVTKIRERAFADSELSSITFPSTVTTFSDYAFSNTKLSSVTLPSGLKFIGRGSFQHCDSLNSIKIPKGVTYLPDYTFYDCSILQTIYIPKAVTSINYRTLSSTQLQDIYYEGSAEDWAAIEISTSNNEALYGLGGTLDSPGMFAPTFHYNTNY